MGTAGVVDKECKEDDKDRIDGLKPSISSLPPFILMNDYFQYKENKYGI